MNRKTVSGTPIKDPSLIKEGDHVWIGRFHGGRAAGLHPVLLLTRTQIVVAREFGNQRFRRCDALALGGPLRGDYISGIGTERERSQWDKEQAARVKKEAAAQAAWECRNSQKDDLQQMFGGSHSVSIDDREVFEVQLRNLNFAQVEALAGFAKKLGL